MRIYVIRHGETLLNYKGVLQGWLDVALNEKGKEEARKTGEGLKGIIFKKAFSSPLIRAKETTKIILEASGNLTTPLSVENRIKEINFGEYEGQVYKKPNGETVDDKYLSWKCVFKPYFKKYINEHFSNGMLEY